MKLSIEQETIYRYDSPVRSSTQYIRLTPRESSRQKVFQWQLDTPRGATQTHDGYGNVLHVLTLDKPVREIRIRAHGRVETSPLIDQTGDMPAGNLSPLVFLRSTPITRTDDALVEFSEPFRRRTGTLSALRDLAAALLKKIALSDSIGEVPPSAPQVFAAGAGCVRDQAHVFIACCRHLGIPARYVSGYVLLLDENETARIAGHAWTETWIGERWRSFDLAYSRAAGEHHLNLAVGADYLDACPIRGTRTGGGVESMEATMKVQVTR
jgi:transglutaminase-like putative cysteine protease